MKYYNQPTNFNAVFLIFKVLVSLYILLYDDSSNSYLPLGTYFKLLQGYKEKFNAFNANYLAFLNIMKDKKHNPTDTFSIKNITFSVTTMTQLLNALSITIILTAYLHYTSKVGHTLQEKFVDIKISITERFLHYKKNFAVSTYFIF